MAQLKAKDVEKRLAKVNDTLYMGKGEVTNGEFREFIWYLDQSGQQHLAKQYRTDSTKWFTHRAGQKMSIHYHTHEVYGNYPVVAISYEAAVAFCDWLTTQYSLLPNRKFKTVKFRLPTEYEWMEAAYAGNYENRYPWGNYLIRRTGEFMAMYRKISDQRVTFDTVSKTYKVIITPEEIAEWDGSPAPVITFWPNPFGIYHQSGNVAEMVMQKGIAKGGGFNDPGYDIQIISRKSYSQPSVEIGFRIVMQVLK